jgi:hypothetical protein
MFEAAASCRRRSAGWAESCNASRIASSLAGNAERELDAVELELVYERLAA